MILSEKTQLALRNGATDYLTKELKIKLVKTPGSTGASGSNAARNEGKTDGRNYDTQKPGRVSKLN